MPRFFVRQTQIDENIITLVGDDAHHIARSLRMAIGDSVTVCDMQGNEYDCRIDGFDDDKQVYVRIISSQRAQTEPCCRITLYQALPKGDKLDTVIQKAVECGVGEIVPFESDRCVVKVKAEAEQRKTERRNRISEEAAKQCGRSVLPKVSHTVQFDEALKMASEADVCLFCYEGDGTAPLGRVLREHLEKKEDGSYPDVAVVVGSEGGFSINEAEKAKQMGAILTGLGKRILRTETAPIFVLSCLVMFTELE